MYPMALRKKIPKSQRPRVDRFVLPRDSIVDLRKRINEDVSCGNKLVEIWDPKYLRAKNYMKYLDEAFGVETIALQEYSTSGDKENYIRSWPCIPRKKSFLCLADSVLDLPTYSDAPLPDLLDWSNDNVLAAALGRRYYQWSWRTQRVIGIGYTAGIIYCCKFDPRGELLALGTEKGTLEIHHEKSIFKTVRSKCYCCTKCSLTAVDWSPTGSSLVIGCTNGALMALTRSGYRIRWVHLSIQPIGMVRVSPNARYVAMTTMLGQYAFILTWPLLESYSKVEVNGLTIIAWHPWRSALLAVSGFTSDHKLTISLWNIPSKTLQKFVTVGKNKCCADTMMFSHKTGELVLSLWDTDSSRLIVMSDTETVVDQYGDNKNGLDRVRTMVFSPDGTKLDKTDNGLHHRVTRSDDGECYDDECDAKCKKTYPRGGYCHDIFCYCRA